LVYVSSRQRQVIDAFFVIAKENPDITEISMQMLADKVGIRRQSIYEKHFRSVDDIITLIHKMVDEDIENKIQGFLDKKGKDPMTFFAKEILPLLYEKREWLKVLYSSALDPSWVIYLQKKYRPLIKAYLKPHLSSSGISEDFICNLLVEKVLAIVSTWLTSDAPDPASLFEEKFLYLMKTSISDLID
jgi:predicted DNA-binding protein YlxM (UPF0122 family)